MRPCFWNGRTTYGKGVLGIGRGRDVNRRRRVIPGIAIIRRRRIVGGGQAKIIEGDGLPRNVVIEFDSVEKAVAAHESEGYQAALKVFGKAAERDKRAALKAREIQHEFEMEALHGTLITLKNQVDDLLDQFREYYQGKAKLTKTDLRRSYDLLLMKVLSLLQDKDPPLASAIVFSRDFRPSWLTRNMARRSATIS